MDQKIKRGGSKNKFAFSVWCSMSLCIPCICGYLTPLPLSADQATPVATADAEGQSLFEQAQKLLQEKNYKEAKDTLNQLVAKHPMGDFIPQARLLLANLQEDFDVSVAQFRSLAIEYSDRPEGAEAQKELGARYYLADKYEDAAESYKEFLEDYPKNTSSSEVRYWYASSLLALDDDKDALEQFKKVVDDAPDSPWAPKALMGMGDACFKMKKYGDAENRYLRILDKYHLYDELNLVYLKLGRAYEAEQKWKEAHAAYQTLIQQYPQAFEVSEARGRLQALESQHPDLPHVPEAQAAQEATPTAEAVSAAPTATVVPPDAEEEADQGPGSISKPFHVQVGVYSKMYNVEKARKAVKKAGYSSYVVTVQPEGVPYAYYKVRVGSYADRATAEKTAKEIIRKTKERAIVIED